MDKTAAFLIGAVALYLLFAGFRFARSAISLWGFVVGYLLGGTVASDMLNVGSFGTNRSALLGLALAIFSALFAYTYYGFALIVLLGGIGYWLGSGFLLLLGFVPGAVSAIGGLLIGSAGAIAILRFGVTKYTLIILTSLAGSVSLIGSILVVLHKASLESLSYISVTTGTVSSLLWLLAAIAFTAIGVSIQTLTTPDRECEKWILHSSGGGSRHSGARTMR